MPQIGPYIITDVSDIFQVRWWYFVFRKNYDVNAVLSMQTMIATVASLVAGITVGAFTSVNFDELSAAEQRFADSYGEHSVFTNIKPAMAYVCATSFTLSMVCICFSLCVYSMLTGVNIPPMDRQAGNQGSRMFMLWMKTHYWLLFTEVLATIFSIIFLWFVLYFVGLVKYGIHYAAWSITCVIGVVSIAVFAYVADYKGTFFYRHMTSMLLDDPALKFISDNERPPGMPEMWTPPADDEP